MGDNTFPNLMAVLTGFNKTYANARCHPEKVRGLDACPFIWKDFKDKGYTTAFAEDWSKFSTFDYSSRAFQSSDRRVRQTTGPGRGEGANDFTTGSDALLLGPQAGFRIHL